MPRVTFIHPEGKSGEVPRDISLLKAAEHLGLPLEHDCGVNASCSTCWIDVVSGENNFYEIDFEEQDLLDREALTEPYHRLSCQAKVLGDVIVQVPDEKWGGSGSDVSGDSNRSGMEKTSKP